MSSLSFPRVATAGAASPKLSVAVVGDGVEAWTLARQLDAGGIAVSLHPSAASLAAQPPPRSTPMLAVLSELEAVAALEPAFPQVEAGWVGWDLTADPRVALAAYRRGARAVVPGSADVTVLTSVLTTLPASAPSAAPPERRRTHRRGDRIALSEHHVLTVVSGVLALGVLHDDGTDVLLGLSGPGDLVVGHPEDRCCLQLTAHTDAAVEVLPWSEATRAADFAARIRTRLRGMEAWSAAQARPHLRHRLTGVLELLAEQFGVPHGKAVVIDVRLTHGQLASTVGATRATVTRLLAQLKRRHRVSAVRRGPDERLCLLAHDPTHHHHGVRSLRVS